MRRLHESKIDDAKYYEWVWDDVMKNRAHFDTVRQEALIKYVKNGDVVCDVGAGIFGSSQYIATHKKNLRCKLYAYDQSYTAKDIVAKLTPEVKYILGDCEKIKLSTDIFDCVFAGEVIEHMEQPALFVKELVRITRKNGWISISTVDTKCEKAIAHGDYPEHVWEFEPEDLIKFFKPYGETTYEVVGNYHFIYCKKY